MLIGWCGGRRSGAELGLVLAAEKAWLGRARGSARDRRLACQPATLSGGRARRAGVGLRSAVREARSPAQPQPSSAPRAPASFPPLPCTPVWGLGRGTEGRDERRRKPSEGRRGSRRGARRALPLVLSPQPPPPRWVPRSRGARDSRGARTMQADCRPPRWRAERW